MLADRLRERTTVRLYGEVAAFVDGSDRSGKLGINWQVFDCPAETAELGARAGNLDTVFIVATPESLTGVNVYEQVASEHGLDHFLIVNRFIESERNRLKAFDGPDVAEYFYEDESIPAAMQAGTPPTLDNWTVEAPLMEAVQPERTTEDKTLKTLETGSQRIVNVEVTDQSKPVRLLQRSRTLATALRISSVTVSVIVDTVSLNVPNSPAQRKRVTFEYCQPAVQQGLTGVRHGHDCIVSATTHAHVQDKHCMELFVLEGTIEELSGFVNTVRAVPDIRAVEYSVISLVDTPIDQAIES